MCATLAADVFVVTRPTYSSMSLGLLPAEGMRVACGINVGMAWAFGFRLLAASHRSHKRFYRRGDETDPKLHEQSRTILRSDREIVAQRLMSLG